MVTDSVKGSGKEVVLPSNAGDVPNIISVEVKKSSKGFLIPLRSGWKLSKRNNFHIIQITKNVAYREIKIRWLLIALAFFEQLFV